MKRDFLKGLELSDEVIEKIMAENGKDVQALNSKVDKYKTDAEKVAELEKQLEDINNANLSEIDKAVKEKDKALDQIAKLQADIATMQLKNELANIGIIGEEADTLFKDGKLNVSVLGEILKNTVETTKSETIREIADKAEGQGASSGASGNDGGDEETPDVAMAKSLVFGTPAVEEAVRDAYVLH